MEGLAFARLIDPGVGIAAIGTDVADVTQQVPSGVLRPRTAKMGANAKEDRRRQFDTDSIHGQPPVLLRNRCRGSMFGATPRVSVSTLSRRRFRAESARRLRGGQGTRVRRSPARQFRWSINTIATCRELHEDVAQSRPRECPDVRVGWRCSTHRGVRELNSLFPRRSASVDAQHFKRLRRRLRSWRHVPTRPVERRVGRQSPRHIQGRIR